MLITYWKYFLAGFVGINAVAYGCMWRDKLKAIRQQKRIPEKRLLLLALCFGAAGIYSGMKKPLYHKATKPWFRYLVPLLFIAQLLVIIYCMWQAINSP